MKRSKFAKIENNMFYNEWYGSVSADDMYRIIRMKMSPSDYTIWKTHTGESLDYYDAWR